MSSLRFVVRKHRATTVHYDFRLEIDGVLKSWAVPKAPSPEPGEKRLAVRTEHHRDDAGQVDLWDEGTWIPEESPLTAYRRGRLKFELKGRRLQGRWALVRMGNAQTRKKDLWLLTKLEDDAHEARAPARLIRRRPAGGEREARR